MNQAIYLAQLVSVPSPTNSGRNKEASAYLKEAEELILTSQFEKAEKVLKEALKLYPKSSELWSKLGVLYSETSYPSEADKAFKKALGLNPTHPEANYYLGFRNHQEWQLVEAKVGYEQKIKENPRSVELYDRLGQCFLILRSYLEAFEAFKKAHCYNPDFPPLYVNLSSFYLVMEELITNLKMSEVKEEIIGLLNDMLTFAKKSQLIEGEMIRADKDTPSQNIRYVLLMVVQRFLEEGAKRNLYYAPGFLNLGVLCLAKKDFEKAEENLKKAIALNPRLAEAYFNLGIVLLQTQRSQAAEKAFDEATRLGYPNGDNYFELAVTYLFQFKEIERAKKYFRVAHRLFKENQLEGEFFKRLENVILNLRNQGGDFLKTAEELEKFLRELLGSKTRKKG